MKEESKSTDKTLRSSRRKMPLKSSGAKLALSTSESALVSISRPTKPETILRPELRKLL